VGLQRLPKSNVVTRIIHGGFVSGTADATFDGWSRLLEMDLETDKMLVEEAGANPEAFGKIFDRYFPEILGYAIRRTANVELGRDLAAETFLLAFRHLWRFRWSGISLSSWLYRIASNQIVSHFRLRDSSAESLEELHAAAGFEPRDRTDLLGELLEAERELQQRRRFLEIQARLARLAPRYQQVLALRYFEGRTVHEIAEISGRKEGTVKSLLARGLEQLRRKP
jgi:RNA polymerase sigma-70 factor (ECF subfamily)